jgi:hypothetical protein
MISGLLAAAAVAAAAPPSLETPDTLDGADLRGVMETARKTPASAPLAGRPFRIAIPFVDGRKRDMKTFQSPARWTYDYRRHVLKVIIGLGELSSTNYDRFEKQGLEALPPLQTVFFNADEIHNDVFIHKYERERNYSEETALASIITNYGLAVPYAAGASALPARFEPLMVYETQLDPRDLRARVKGMTLVIEGRLTALGQQPEVFCGDYNGTLAARDTNDTVKLVVTAHQCFVTARIDRVVVADSDSNPMTTWGPPAAP